MAIIDKTSRKTKDRTLFNQPPVRTSFGTKGLEGLPEYNKAREEFAQTGTYTVANPSATVSAPLGATAEEPWRKYLTPSSPSGGTTPGDIQRAKDLEARASAGTLKPEETPGTLEYEKNQAMAAENARVAKENLRIEEEARKIEADQAQKAKTSLGLQEKILAEKKRNLTRQTESATAYAQSKFGPSADTSLASTAAGTVSGVTGNIASTFKQNMGNYQLAQNELEQARLDIEDARKSNEAARIEAATQRYATAQAAVEKAYETAVTAQEDTTKKAQEVFTSISPYLSTLTEEEKAAAIKQIQSVFGELPDAVVEGIMYNAKTAKMSDDAKTKFDNTTKANAVLGSMISTGIPIDYKTATSLAEGTVYTPDQIVGLFSKADGIRKTVTDKIEQQNQINALVGGLNGEAMKSVESETQAAIKGMTDLKNAVADGIITQAQANNLAIGLGFAPKPSTTTSTTGTTTSTAYTSPVGIVSQVVNGTLNIQEPEGYADSLSRVTGQKGKQCAEFVRDVTGVGFGDMYADKASKINETVPNVGDIFVENISPYGHVGLVSKIYEKDGQQVVDTVEYNYASNQTRSDRVGVPISEFTGFVKNPNVQKKQYSQDVINLSDAIDLGETTLNSSNIPDELYQDLVNYRAERRETAGGDSQAYKDAVAIMNGNAKLTNFGTARKQAITGELDKLKEEARASGDIYGLMRASAGGNNPDQSLRNSLVKAGTTTEGINALVDMLNKDKTTDVESGLPLDLSPISGWIAQNNPWDTDAQTMRSILTSTVPNLARGVYGEVGVLTDNDVALYMQTLPNLRQVSDVKKAVTAMTLRIIRNSVENQLEVAAESNIDVSKLEGYYKKLDDKVKSMEKSLGIVDENGQDQTEEVRTTKIRKAINAISQYGDNDNSVLEKYGIKSKY